VIEEIDHSTLSDSDVGHRNAIDNLLQAEEVPQDPPRPVEYTAARLRNIPEFMAVREFWAREPDGGIAGFAETSWTKTDDNRHLVRMFIAVRPDRRKQGLGTNLLRLVSDVAEAEGRTLLMSFAYEDVPSGAAFAKRVGAEAGQAVHTNRLLLSEVDTDMVDRWIEHGPARAPGYSLVTIDGAAPDEYVGEVVRMANVMNTAPRDDLDMEDETFEVSHLRDWEHVAEAQGDLWWAIFARHEASGQFAGYTHVTWNPQVPETVYQYGTAVAPEHRGHAIGKWVKASMIRRILDERPGVRDIRTGNADSNDAMLGINHALGFRPFMAATWWQVKVDKVREYLLTRHLDPEDRGDVKR
jgi:GNAT superfamily N-acetyltransferase